MKRFAVHLALFAMLANSASAGIIVQGSVGPTVNNPLVDVSSYKSIIFKLTGFTGADDTAAVFPSGTNSVSSMAGTWSVTGGSMFFSDLDGFGDPGAQAANTVRPATSSSTSLNSYRSFMNFEGTAGDPTPADASGGELISSFNYSWFTTGSNLPSGTNANRTRLTPVDTLAGSFDQTLVGRIFITPGATVTFNGVFSSAVAVNQPVTFSFSDGVIVTPDPIAVTVAPASGTPLGVGQNVSVSNAAAGPNGRDSATIAGLTVTSVAGTFGQVGLSNGVVAPGGNQVGTVTFDGTGLLNGYTANGNLSFSVAPGPNGAGTGGGPYTYPLQALVSGNVGDGIAPTGPGGSYAGLSGTSGLTSAGGSVHLPSTFSILAGSNANGGGTVVSGVWTLRALNEQRPGFTNPPLPDFASALTSDKVNLTGMDGDVFVLQMSYAESELEGNEADDAAKGHLYLATLNGNGEWVNAIALNHGANVGATNVQGAWSGQLALGTWGVDTAANTVWAVLDHNSVFASVPEPSTILLGLMGLVGLVGLARRRRS